MASGGYKAKPMQRYNFICITNGCVVLKKHTQAHTNKQTKPRDEGKPGI